MNIATETLVERVKALTTEQKEIALQYFPTKMLRSELAFRDDDTNNRLSQLNDLLSKYDQGIPDRETFEKFFGEIAAILKGVN